MKVVGLWEKIWMGFQNFYHLSKDRFIASFTILRFTGSLILKKDLSMTRVVWGMRVLSRVWVWRTGARLCGVATTVSLPCEYDRSRWDVYRVYDYGAVWLISGPLVENLGISDANFLFDNLSRSKHRSAEWLYLPQISHVFVLSLEFDDEESVWQGLMVSGPHWIALVPWGRPRPDVFLGQLRQVLAGRKTCSWVSNNWRSVSQRLCHLSSRTSRTAGFRLIFTTRSGRFSTPGIKKTEIADKNVRLEKKSETKLPKSQKREIP